tara:strand:- start:1988 stop:2251 length:264 start_codon:yes stop_codon:yes gene_type:complete
MIKNILSVFIFLFSISFFYLIFNIYFSDDHRKKIEINRKTFFQKVKNDINKLPVLANDTDNVIEFNSGFETQNKKIERSFWELFKKK